MTEPSVVESVPAEVLTAGREAFDAADIATPGGDYTLLIDAATSAGYRSRDGEVERLSALIERLIQAGDDLAHWNDIDGSLAEKWDAAVSVAREEQP